MRSATVCVLTPSIKQLIDNLLQDSRVWRNLGQNARCKGERGRPLPEDGVSIWSERSFERLNARIYLLKAAPRFKRR
jgi:hypothetical protein